MSTAHGLRQWVRCDLPEGEGWLTDDWPLWMRVLRPRPVPVNDEFGAIGCEPSAGPDENGHYCLGIRHDSELNGGSEWEPISELMPEQLVEGDQGHRLESRGNPRSPPHSRCDSNMRLHRFWT
jgi:hypothetical protein